MSDVSAPGCSVQYAQAMNPASKRPQAVRLAVLLMLVGAAVAVFEMIVLAQNMHELLTRFFAGIAPKPRPLDEPVVVYPWWGISLDTLTNLMTAVIVALALTVVACCLWLAWMTSQRRNWARILATVLGVGFAIGWITLLTAGSMLDVFEFSPAGTFTVIVPLLVAVPTVILLWTPSSDAFFER